jgi:SET and MYND domain-containing protein 4
MEYTPKDDIKAKEFCLLGNDKFVERNYFEALLYLNKSLCFAQSPETSAMTFAVRATVYLKLKFYDRCLTNIRLSRNAFKIEHKHFTTYLDIAEKQCRDELPAQTKASDSYTALVSDFLKLSYPANPKLPFAAECLELKENKKFGRHIVTNRNLKAGDIIAITPNIYNFINKEARFHHCSSCLRSNDMNLFPCPGCPNGKMTATIFMHCFQFFVLVSNVLQPQMHAQ